MERVWNKKVIAQNEEQGIIEKILSNEIWSEICGVMPIYRYYKKYFCFSRHLCCTNIRETIKMTLFYMSNQIRLILYWLLVYWVNNHYGKINEFLTFCFLNTLAKIAEFRWKFEENFIHMEYSSPRVYKKISYQILKILNYLHRNFLCGHERKSSTQLHWS